jgi:hypothetical protein
MVKRSKKEAADTSQPLAKHYNGQCVLRPSVVLDLAGGDFMQRFETVWDEHVNFGTAKSHKKLARRDSQQQMEWHTRLHDKRDRESAVAPKAAKKKRRREESGAQAEAPKPQPGQPQPQPRPPQPPTGKAALPSKGRWNGCLAAKILSN